MSLFTLSASSLTLSSTGILAASGTISETQILQQIGSASSILGRDPYLRTELSEFQSSLQPLTTLSSENLHQTTDHRLISTHASDVIDLAGSLSVQAEGSGEANQLKGQIEASLERMTQAVATEEVRGADVVEAALDISGAVEKASTVDRAAAVQLQADIRERPDVVVRNIRRIFVPNRGEAAVRLITAVTQLNRERGADERIEVYVMYTQEDKGAPPIVDADHAFFIPPEDFREVPDPQDAKKLKKVLPFNDLETIQGLLSRVIQDAEADGLEAADVAVWPGWGFQSENPELSRLCQEMGVRFIGASPEAMAEVGDKIGFKRLADPTQGTWGEANTLDEAQATAERIGYPVVIKATAGGGGRGIKFVHTAEGLPAAYAAAQDEARQAFNNEVVFIEKAILPTETHQPRHVEIQIIADQYGQVVAVGDRDCSIQRNNQKIIEEAPAPNIPDDRRAAIHQLAVRVVREANYVGPATVEGLFDGENFFPMELNARLQVEHTITEEVTGVDLVKEMIGVAEGRELTFSETPAARGVAIEVRINAENPDQGFETTGGTLDLFRPPGHLRFDTGVRQGSVVIEGYDPMMGKLIATGRDRTDAIANIQGGLESFAIDGVQTNRGFALEVLAHPAFRGLTYSNQWLEKTYMPERKPWEVKLYSHEALIAAAILAYRQQRKRYDDRLLHLLSKGRPPALAPRKEAEFVFALFGREYRLSVCENSRDYVVTVDGRDYTVQVESKGQSGCEYNMTIEGKRIPVVGSGKDGTYPVSLHGVAFTVDSPPVGEVRATTNGTLLSYEMNPGDEVKAGDVVAILEVMKIKKDLRAPLPGILEEPQVSAGGPVVQGQLLVRIKEDGSGRQKPEAPRLEFHPSFESPLQRLFHVDPKSDARGETVSLISADMPRYFGEATSVLREAILGFDSIERLYRSIPRGFTRVDELSPYTAGLLEVLEAAVVERGYTTVQNVPDEVIAEAVISILDAFVDVEILFQREALRESVERRSMVDQVYDFLKTRKISDDVFKERLLRALAHYGVTSVDETSPALDRALIRILMAHEKIGIRQELIQRVFRWVQSIHQRGGLRGQEQRIDETLAEFDNLDRDLAVLTHSAQGLLFTFHEAELDKLGREQAAARVTQLVEAAKQYSERSDARQQAIREISGLADATVHALIEHILGDDIEMARIASEARFQRLYRDRHELVNHAVSTKNGNLVSLGIFKDGETGVTRIAVGMVSDRTPLDRRGVQGFIKRAVQSLDEFRRGVTELGAQETMDNTLELAIPVLSDDLQDLGRLAEVLPDLIGFVPTKLNIKRITLTLISGTGEAHYLTFRDPQRAGRYSEDKLFRGIHPYRAAQLELWRLRRHWDVEKLTTPWTWNNLFRLTEGQGSGKKAKDLDRRLFSYAIIRHLSPPEDDRSYPRYPEIDLAFGQAIHSIREAVQQDSSVAAHRIHLILRPEVTMTREHLERAIGRLAPLVRRMKIEETNVRLLKWRASEGDEYQDILLRVRNPSGSGLKINAGQPAGKPEGYVKPRSLYKRGVARNQALGLVEAYQFIRDLTADTGNGRGEFQELDIQNVTATTGPRGEDTVRYDLNRVDREPGNNTGKIVFGILTRRTEQHPEGIQVMQIANDATYGLCPLQEPECARVIAALDYAEEHGLEVDWKATSSGAGITMDVGVENLDWTARVMRRIGEFCDAGGTINIIVDGGNIGAQSYWDANATMALTRHGVLIKVHKSYTALTGNRAQMISGSVGAEDNIGLAGAERVTGPIGETQFFVPTINDAVEALWTHHDLTWRAPGQIISNSWETNDPVDRDVTDFNYVDPALGMTVAEVLADDELRKTVTVHKVGAILADKEKKTPFPVEAIMAAVRNADAPVQKRWHLWKSGGADLIRVEQTVLGTVPTTLIGIDAQPLTREGEIPPGYPDMWSGSTLFPEGSKKVARAINAASGRMDVAVLANLSGFDGSPESLRNNQLEWGTAIEEAVRKFKGKIAFLVVTRYHGGAYVVFSRVINDNMTVGAVENTYASVIGGNIATKLIFARKINKEADKRLKNDPAILLELQAARTPEAVKAIRDRVRDEVEGEFQLRYDGIHTVEKAVAVGAIAEVIPASQMRPWLIRQLEEGRAEYRAQVERQLQVWRDSLGHFAGMGETGVAQWEAAVRNMGLGPLIMTLREPIDRGQRSAPEASVVREVRPSSVARPGEASRHFVAEGASTDVGTIQGLGQGFRKVDLGIPADQIGECVIAFDRVGSTNDAAKEALAYGVIEGTVIVADEQTEGRGRSGKTWVSKKGAGLYASFAVKPNIAEGEEHRLTFAVAAAVAKAVGGLSDQTPSIKWPNDIYLGDKKLAGILIEKQGDGHYVVGIGLNTNATPDDLGSVDQASTSLLIDTGKSWDQQKVLKELLLAINIEIARINSGEWARVLKYIRGRSYLEGRRVLVTRGDDVIGGVVRGISSDGALLLDVPGEDMQKIFSGTIELDRGSRPPDRP